MILGRRWYHVSFSNAKWVKHTAFTVNRICKRSQCFTWKHAVHQTFKTLNFEDSNIQNGHKRCSLMVCVERKREGERERELLDERW